MNKLAVAFITVVAVFVAACVTINVYFPEAAATEAADRIIDKVRGEEAGNGGDTGASLARPDADRVPVMLALAHGVTSFLVSDANAQGAINFDRPSPEKTALDSFEAQTVAMAVDVAIADRPVEIGCRGSEVF